MTDAHTHIAGGGARSFLCVPPLAVSPAAAEGDVLFRGIHPWDAQAEGVEARLDALAAALAADRRLGVGEIGLDRLKSREIPDAARAVFRAQLALAADFRRPAVLHGAKCWGQVARAAAEFKGSVPAFLFHGFSRSDGLIPEIARLGGFISVGSAVLNDHAVNYREMVKKIPENMLLLETDSVAEGDRPPLAAIAAKVAELRCENLPELEALTDANAARFAESLAG